ncbi:PREDICTED: endoplasmic reticulum membrane-associated RNA degradation protein-like [Condylura cristata]|uniref:endoplasmic reticulum membrane-associated RNA degradation protein-like n=1 Tax=Condylura cristata TaxID=143302 RepID=UPI0006429407|nr:PREDICTED: endoplasmic reticulum membrane-associated RNA degradation protein-like [Condylura cristata]
MHLWLPARALRRGLGGDAPATCLSPTVHELICKVGFEAREHLAASAVVSPCGEVCWPAFTGRLVPADSGEGLDYRASVRLLGPDATALCPGVPT